MKAHFNCADYETLSRQLESVHHCFQMTITSKCVSVYTCAEDTAGSSASLSDQAQLDKSMRLLRSGLNRNLTYRNPLDLVAPALAILHTHK